MRPPYKPALEPPVRRAARVPADHRRQPAVHGRQRRRVVALNRTTGKKVGARRSATWPPRRPPTAERRIYVTILERSQGRPRRAASSRWTRDGKIPWSKDLPSRSESSPLYVDGRVYFGAEDGTVYAMRAGPTATCAGRSGRAARSRAARAGRRQALLRRPTAGNVYAISQKTASRSGAPAPAAPTSALRRQLLRHPGGRLRPRLHRQHRRQHVLVLGRDRQARVAARDRLATSTPRRPSPRSRDGKPTVYFGSYDGTFYALDARTGKTRWTYHDGGKISGGATVIGDIVYYSNWGKRDTTGLWARSGKKAWPTRAAPSTRWSPTARRSTSPASRRSARSCPRRPPRRARPPAAGEEGRQGEGRQEAQGGEEEGRAAKKRKAASEAQGRRRERKRCEAARRAAQPRASAGAGERQLQGRGARAAAGDRVCSRPTDRHSDVDCHLFGRRGQQR